MIIVDRGVWADYFVGNKTDQVLKLDQMLGRVQIGTSELIYTDVLRGFVDEKDFDTAKKLFALLTELKMVSPRIALKSAEFSRQLRDMGISVRNTLDLMIATYCIDNGYPLLYTGRNFVHFESHLGLVNALDMELHRKAS